MSPLIRFPHSLPLDRKGVLLRTTHRRQLSLPVPSVPHKHARMLASMAAILDAMPELEEQVLSDLTSDGVRSDFGRDGLSAQQVLRLMVLYTMLRTTFEQLEFHLADSPTYRAFCLLGLTDPPPKRASIAGNLPSCVRRRFRLSTCTSSAMPSSTSWRRCQRCARTPLRSRLPFALRSILRFFRTPFVCSKDS